MSSLETLSEVKPRSREWKSGVTENGTSLLHARTDEVTSPRPQFSPLKNADQTHIIYCDYQMR